MADVAAVLYTMLVVDADLKAMADAVAVLSQAGYFVINASSFDEAKQHLAVVVPDLLMADICLGAYNGLHLAIRGRLQFPEMAAIITHVAPDPVLEAETAALNGVYLVKPVEEHTLLRVVHGLIRERP